MRFSMVCNGLIVCFLFCSVLSAQTATESALTSPPQAVEPQFPILEDSTDLTESQATSAADAPLSDASQTAQDNGNSSSGGNGNGSGGGSGTTSGSAAAPAASGYVFPHVKHYWLESVVGYRAAAGAVFGASWNTWVSGVPSEWDSGAKGWSQRLGVVLMDNTINQTTLVLLSSAMHQDPKYYRCDCVGVWPRTRHALKMTITARKRNGDATFTANKLIAPFSGPLVSRNTVFPSRFGSWDALRGGIFYTMGTVSWNLIREFIWKSPQW